MGRVLTLAAVLLFLGAGLYQLLWAIGFFNAMWGLLGIIVFFIFPPLWFFAPFVMWAMTGVFPATYFLAWAIGWIGSGVLFSLGQTLSKSQPSQA